ncbi:kelch repeat-containing protein [Robiginitalea sp. SC105]|uniref:Kelch repeat-containing protein n=1 Tax=Robiginitalea sp. SC105 TaxID=2762332 RepID=UPI00163A0E7D|nr:kelch repeat-containing protein [Robiginitalea sp. SC105]MBC2839846.1 galactose oxidase [Robiginitalea sp. SC105]
MIRLPVIPIAALFTLSLLACNGGERTSKNNDSATAAEETDRTDPAWEFVESTDGSKPVARHEAAFVGVGDKFYLLGGRGIRPVSIYDTQTGIWSEGPEPPIEMHHFQPVVVGSKVYILGALTGGYPAEYPVDHIYVYDTESNTWTRGDAIPENRQRGSTGNVLSGDKIYMLCGIKNGHIGDHKNWADSYDLKTGEWEVLADAPRTRDHFQAAMHKGRIYALAGRNTGSADTPFGGTVAEVDVYDIASDTWSTVAKPIPTERAGTFSTVFDGHVLVAGGESTLQEKAHAEVEGLNPETGEWRSYPSFNQGRHGTGLVVYGGAVYTASGCGNRGGTPELTTMERLVIN